MFFLDLTGKRFGILNVISRDGTKIYKNGNKKALWKCQCDCGKMVSRTTDSLKRSKEKASCGCVKIQNQKINRLGKKYGKLEVIQELEKGYWLCRCDCGNIKKVFGNNLGRTTFSCGCLKGEKISSLNMKTDFKYSHERLFKIWTGIKTRCYNSNCKAYKNYGARGIKICEEWKNEFLNFRDWSMQNGYKEDLTIDRIDVNGNYEPSNCRWVSMEVQARNKRNSIILNYKNRTYSIKELCKKYEITYSTLYQRIYRGWSLNKALNFKKNDKNREEN